jgi:hypothetical protein
VLNETHHADSVNNDIRSKLEERVKAAGMMDRFVSCDAEKEIVLKAVDHGLPADYAANVVAAISVEKGFAREAELNHILTIVLKHLADDGVDKKEFDEAVAIASELSHGVVPLPKLQKKAKQLMVDNGLKAQSGGLFSADWFKAI